MLALLSVAWNMLVQRATKRRGPEPGAENQTREPAGGAGIAKRRGRPPGAKNQTREPAGGAGTAKRRGRPSGAKNQTQKPAGAAGVAKRRGRPPGAMNTKLSKARLIAASVAAGLHPNIGVVVRVTWTKRGTNAKPGTFTGRVTKQTSVDRFMARFSDNTDVKLTGAEVTAYAAAAVAWDRVESIHAMSPPGAATVCIPFTCEPTEPLVPKLFMIQGAEGCSAGLEMDSREELPDKWQHSFGLPFHVYDTASTTEMSTSIQGRVHVSLSRAIPALMPADGSVAGPGDGLTVRLVGLQQLEDMLAAPGNDGGKGLAPRSREGARAAYTMLVGANMR